jgi:PAS domain S-box-containing protein
MNRIVFISPYRDLSLLAKSIAEEMNLNVEFYEAWYEEAGNIVRKLTGQPVDVLISRGGTAEYLAKHFEVPVIPVNVSPYDILEGLDEALNYGRNIAITSFGEHIVGLDLMEKVFKISITEVIFHDIDDLKIKIEALALAGNYCVLGGGPSVEFAKENGLAGIFLHTNRATLQAAFVSADKMATMRQEEMRRARQLETIMEAAYEGIIAVNAEGRIDIFNAAAAKMFGLVSDQVLGKEITTIVPNSNLTHVLLTGEAELDKLQDTGRSQIMTNRMPIKSDAKIVGAVATFQETTRIVQAANKISKEGSGQQQFRAKACFTDLVGKSRVFEVKKRIAEDFAKSELTILLYGASGTGKELFAQSIHNASTRKGGPFVAVNCGALPPSLLESELFGYEDGAFTGARRRGRSGMFELARCGTIFLDEVDALPLETQGRFLRVLQEREILRVGGETLIPVNVRVIAATNKHSEELLNNRIMREDLFYRLNVLWLELPPLSNRREDIRDLCEHFLPQDKMRQMRPIISKLLPYFEQYSWPGNIRELQNIIQRISFFVDAFEEETIFDYLNMVAPSILSETQTHANEESRIRGQMKGLEQELILKAVAEHKPLEKAAEFLGIGRSTLVRKLKEIRGS